MKVVCFGDVGVDRYEDAAGAFKSRPGGCALNVAVNLSRATHADVTVQVVSAVGDDPAGMLSREVIRRERLVDFVETLAGATAMQRIRVEENGEKVFVGYDAGVLPRLKLTRAQSHAIETADAVVTVLYAQVDALMRDVLARPRSGKLVCDFMTMKDYGALAAVEWALARCDVAFFGLQPSETALMERLRAGTRGTSRVVVVTLGASGGVAFTDGVATPYAAVPVKRVVDTTGAGDAFAAGFLAAYLRGASLQNSLQGGARCAAQVVQRVGAF